MSLVYDIIPKNIAFGNGSICRGLGVIPILKTGPTELPLIEALDTAINKGTATITETSDAGEVPYLKLENSGDHPVLILDGELLVGGKQNRTINTTILVLAKSTVKIPVSCVQAGRWQSVRPDFGVSRSLFGAKSRAVIRQDVTTDARQSGSFKSNQQSVWNEVGRTLSGLGVQSPTADIEDGRMQVSDRIEGYIQALRPVENQIGAIFMKHDGILGLEMLGNQELYLQECPKIVSSFAFDVLKSPDLKRVSAEKSKQWWAEVLNRNFTEHRSPGAGEDIRVDDDTLLGAGLLLNDHLVHFSCFRKQKQSLKRGMRAPVSRRRDNLRPSKKD